MSTVAAAVRSERRAFSQLLPDLRLGLDNLLVRKLRSLLTMLGMIFGVAAVLAMLSIGAGAQQKVLAFIEQLGVRNLIVEAKETTDDQQHQKIRRLSQGLSFQDYRVISSNVSGIAASTPRKRFAPSKMIPKPQGQMPVVFGVEPSYRTIAALAVTQGRFFDAGETARGEPVCVLGEAARIALFGPGEVIGRYVKVNEQWFHVVGVVGPQLTAAADSSGLPSEDLNNLIYVPLNAAIFRLEDNYSSYRDEIDGIYLHFNPTADSLEAATLVRGILNASHHHAGDFSVIVPAELLAEQRRTERLFSVVMVAIASISLLVGGIGIMNIMLASILERTREIGVRRAVGARRGDIVRQFVLEAVMISFVGGLLGIGFGFGISRLIAWLAGWSTIVTVGSILLAFLVSVSVGLIFGTYPAVKAAKLDPVEAIRYE
ncbi:MAG TPA: ABC transporter permease [Terriglobia bacterium]|jgi:putative ABC transport system permease protein|nr:ABC transporter permease [Terriglobia bacterium]